MKIAVSYAGSEYNTSLPADSKVVIADDYNELGIGDCLPAARRQLITKLAAKLGIDPGTIDVGLGPGVAEQ